MLISASVLFFYAGIRFFFEDLKQVQASEMWPYMRHPIVVMYIAFIDVLFWWVFTIHTTTIYVMDLLVRAVNRSEE